MYKENIDELLNTLGFIALYKSMLPFSLRGWVNALGLHVQERKAGSWSRLQAGGRFRSCLDAWRQNEGNWQVKKFDRETWERRFAHVVDPTSNISDYLVRCATQSEGLSSEQGVILQRVIEHYESTQHWRWLPGVTTDLEKVSQQMARLEQPKLLEEISHAEQLRIASRYPHDWEFLALLYDLSGRYKDMENALKTAYESVCADFKGFESMAWHWRVPIGNLYFAAFSNSMHNQQVVVLGSLPSKVNSKSLGYTAAEVRILAVETLKAALGDAKSSKVKSDEAELQQIESAIDACEAP